MWGKENTPTTSSLLDGERVFGVFLAARDSLQLLATALFPLAALVYTARCGIHHPLIMISNDLEAQSLNNTMKTRLFRLAMRKCIDAPMALILFRDPVTASTEVQTQPKPKPPTAASTSVHVSRRFPSSDQIIQPLKEAKLIRVHQ